MQAQFKLDRAPIATRRGALRSSRARCVTVKAAKTASGISEVTACLHEVVYTSHKFVSGCTCASRDQDAWIPLSVCTGPKVAIVGITGAVGQEFLTVGPAQQAVTLPIC